ncbi:restriction endonuclease subunit S, partial [Alteromonadaceae bacterium A_SAG4]|nr:restriction endonuclease subunit S [Alteromonadaceae bacterium A_SAG4]
MSFVPIGWSVKTFGEVLSLVTNGMNGKQNKEGNGIPVSRIETIADQRVDLSRVGFLAEYDEGKIDKYRLEEGDILFSHINSPIHLGKTALVPADVVLYHGVNLLRLKCEKSVDPRFFNYYCKYLRALGEFSKNAQHAVNQSSINQKKLKAFELVAPSLEEQRRIADKLDSVLAKVEAAQARLDKIPTILKRFRQSVLAAATSGELTKDWRGDEKYRDETLNWPISKIPESWDLKFLEEVAESRLGKMLDKSKNSGIATKYLGNINLRWHHIDLFELKEILVSQKEIDELNIRDGDLLLCEGGEPGRGAVWKGGDNNLVFQKAIHRVRCTDCISPEFLLYSIENDFFSNRLSLLYTGTTIKHLTGKALKKYPVRIPPIAEQIEIVRMVNRLLEAS